MDGFGLFLRKELRESLRTNRVLVVAAIFALLGIISPLTAKYTPELLKALGTSGGGITISLPTPTVKDAIAQFIKNVAGTGIFVAILLPMGLVAREKERGTAAFVLTKPVTRAAFLSAKLVALMLTLTLGVAVGALATYWYTALLFTPIALGGFVVSSALVLLSLMVYASFTFLGSTLANGQLPAVGIGARGMDRRVDPGGLPKYPAIHAGRSARSGVAGSTGARATTSRHLDRRESGAARRGVAGGVGQLPGAGARHQRVARTVREATTDAVQVLARAALALRHAGLSSALHNQASSMIASGVPLNRWAESPPAQTAARQAVLKHFKALLARGTAAVDELASVTEPEAFGLS